MGIKSFSAAAAQQALQRASASAGAHKGAGQQYRTAPMPAPPTSGVDNFGGGGFSYYDNPVRQAHINSMMRPVPDSSLAPSMDQMVRNSEDPSYGTPPQTSPYDLFGRRPGQAGYGTNTTPVPSGGAVHTSPGPPAPYPPPAATRWPGGHNVHNHYGTPS